MAQERLQKVLSQWGLASRRQAERLIAAGQVQINGAIAEVGQKADPDIDDIWVNGQPISPQQRPQHHYLLLHKPLGVISTCADPEGRTTVLDLLSADLQGVGLHPVGRLDAYTTGALILTNDGALTHYLTHPSHDIAKTYRVEVHGHPTGETLEHWRQGVCLDGRLTRPAQVTLIQLKPDSAELEVTIQEGRNRQIRRVAEQLDHAVIHLHRTAVGGLSLGSVAQGAYRPLTQAEIDGLYPPTPLSLSSPSLSVACS
ncbi:pseudouridine synthase [filamentous cyanobacterium CCP5]|nr:pseudouridine synthase [filamentous cyanobacterium CCP5]